MSRTKKRLLLYDRVSAACSRTTARTYSTSFSLGIRTLSPEIRNDIYAIYGFVRLADEVVDSFDGYDQSALLKRLKEDTFEALDDRISTNPILQAFQSTFHRYGLQRVHVEQFLQSMEWDLERTAYDRDGFDTYIVGSAEVVALMCLKVFVRGNQEEYDQLEQAAVRLGAAFQKVNFLRDLREDHQELGRSYFPDVDVTAFDDRTKKRIEAEIDSDLAAALKGIRRLPRDVRLGVFLAYTYYRRLLQQILRLPSHTILERRVRVSTLQKALLTVVAFARNRLNLV